MLTTYNTRTLEEQVLHCDDVQSFKNDILFYLQSERDAWQEKINFIIKDNYKTKEEFAKLCHVSRTAVSKWCKGSFPNGRDDFIKIGFAAKYNLQEMNFFLQRYGKFPGLYAKSLEDSVYIFVLNSENYPRTYQFCEDIIVQIREIMKNAEDDSESLFDTVQLNNQLRTVESMEQLIAFIRRNASAFREPYKKFYAYVKAFIVANNCDIFNDKELNVNLLANIQGWTSSLRQCVSAIRQRKWFPLRRKVIALGLHLNMTVEQINEMLKLAQMETLCAKNPVESAIIFAVEEAELNDLIFCDGGSELCDYVKNILEELGIQDADKLLNDL